MAIELLIPLAALLPPERDCCGTFKGSPHRSTCPKYRGKFKPTKKEINDQCSQS